MRLFTELYRRLDQTTRSSEKTEALVWYFQHAPARDAAWALYALTSKRLIRAVAHNRLRRWVSAQSAWPGWLVDACYERVGDLSETLALLLPDEAGPMDKPLHEVIEQWILPLPNMTEAQQRDAITDVWRQLDRDQRLLFHKLISGTFRVGAARKLVVNALAQAAGVEPAVMQHRLAGDWQPTAADYQRLISGAERDDDPGQPYPFFLAQQLDDTPSVRTMGEITQWQLEWKWDGIRAQLIRRRGRTMLWSRGDELITDQYPELCEAAQALPDGTVLDGEIIAWEAGQPLPFQALQRRLNRKHAQPRLFDEVPIVFMAYDLLESEHTDRRAETMSTRRDRLEALFAPWPNDAQRHALQLSPVLDADTWAQLSDWQRQARDRGVEGVMLKRRDSPYHTGRPRGPWWKWKAAPFTIDAVMVYAEPGHGKRAGMYTDYTFAVWDRDQLVPVAKAYSGLSAD